MWRARKKRLIIKEGNILRLQLKKPRNGVIFLAKKEKEGAVFDIGKRENKAFAKFSLFIMNKGRGKRKEFFEKVMKTY